MTTFDEREQNFERKFKHDQELAFKVKAWRNRLFGFWAAGELGLTGAAAESYAKEAAEGAIGQPNDDRTVQKVLDDFAAQGRAADPHRLRGEWDRCGAEARKHFGIRP
jgi:hypothetical protein